MTENTTDTVDEFVFDLAAEDYWTPAACSHWPPEKQPRVWFRIPSGPEAQQFTIAGAVLREEHGLESDDVQGFWALPETLDMYLDTAEIYVTRIDNMRHGDAELTWRTETLEEHGLTKRGLLMRLGGSGQQRFFALFGLVSTMMTGLRSATKKNSPATSVSASGSTSTDAPASSAAEPTTEPTS
jgi:hypothetical protein